MVTNVSNDGFASKNLASSDSGGLSNLTKDFDTFLKLLTTQLQNQDPLSPLDTNEFTNQIVSFSQVEQAIETNNKLSALVDLNVSNQISASVNYTGKTVEVASNDMMVKNNAVPTFSYTLDSAAEEVKLVIKNAQGVTVYEGEGLKEKGPHSVQWDRVAKDGTYSPEGKYTITVSAKYKGAEEFKAAPVTTVGVVTGVNLSDTEIISLIVDGELEIPISDVRAVGAPPAANNNSAPVITSFAGELEYDYSEGPLAVDDNIALGDSDDSTINGAIIAIENLKNADKEKLNVELEEGITIQSQDDGILVLSGVATREAYERVLRSLTYENTSGVPNTENRQISILVSDGKNTSNKVSKTVKYNVG